MSSFSMFKCDGSVYTEPSHLIRKELMNSIDSVTDVTDVRAVTVNCTPLTHTVVPYV